MIGNENPTHFARIALLAAVALALMQPTHSFDSLEIGDYTLENPFHDRDMAHCIDYCQQDDYSPEEYYSYAWTVTTATGERWSAWSEPSQDPFNDIFICGTTPAYGNYGLDLNDPLGPINCVVGGSVSITARYCYSEDGIDFDCDDNSPGEWWIYGPGIVPVDQWGPNCLQIHQPDCYFDEYVGVSCNWFTPIIGEECWGTTIRNCCTDFCTAGYTLINYCDPVSSKCMFSPSSDTSLGCRPLGTQITYDDLDEFVWINYKSIQQSPCCSGFANYVDFPNGKLECSSCINGYTPNNFDHGYVYDYYGLVFPPGNFQGCLADEQCCSGDCTDDNWCATCNGLGFSPCDDVSNPCCPNEHLFCSHPLESAVKSCKSCLDDAYTGSSSPCVYDSDCCTASEGSTCQGGLCCRSLGSECYQDGGGNYYAESCCSGICSPITHLCVASNIPEPVASVIAPLTPPMYSSGSVHCTLNCPQPGLTGGQGTKYRWKHFDSSTGQETLSSETDPSSDPYEGTFSCAFAGCGVGDKVWLQSSVCVENSGCSNWAESNPVTVEEPPELPPPVLEPIYFVYALLAALATLALAYMASKAFSMPQLAAIVSDELIQVLATGAIAFMLLGLQTLVDDHLAGMLTTSYWGETQPDSMMEASVETLDHLSASASTILNRLKIGRAHV